MNIGFATVGMIVLAIGLGNDFKGWLIAMGVYCMVASICMTITGV